MKGKPLITANQMTLLRIVLLPLPVWLLYGGTAAQLVGMTLLILLGVTDYLDGMLARRYGSTAFGRFLDPLADKLLLGAMFLPLVHQGHLPAWLVALMFAREFVVTDLRTIYSHLQHDMPTSEAAKIKTNVQIMGGSVMILNIALPHSIVPEAMVGVISAGLILAGIIVRLTGRKIHHRLWVALSLWAFAFLCVWLLPLRAMLIVLLLPIVLFTLYTGWQYLSAGWSRLRGFLASNPLAALDLLLSGLVLPVALVISLRFAPPLVALLYLMLVVEFTVGGIENFLSLKQIGLHWGERFAKLSLICVALLMLIGSSAPEAVRAGLTVCALAVSLFYATWYWTNYRANILAGSGKGA